MELWCLERERAFLHPARRWEDVEGQKVDCPMCAGRHEAMRLEDAPDDAPEGAPTTRLFCLRAVFVACFFGSLISAGVLLAINFHRLGKRSEVVQTLLGSAVGTAILCVAPFLRPEGIAAVFGFMPCLLLLLPLAGRLQADAIQDHVRAGGRMASAWWALLLGLVSGAAILGLLIGVFGYSWLRPVSSIQVYVDDEVYFSGEVTEEEARLLADFFEKEGWFGEPGSVAVHLDRVDARTTLRVAYDDDSWSPPEALAYLEDLAHRVAEGGFGRPLTLEVHDRRGEIVHSVSVE